ncbi:MAG TPA: hypothetical protein VMW41_02065 [Candidatus Bathyarchaeia archaeon]|nr:hypothetical protein [Candidatus Bathyarchaeia archaeon]
MKTAASILKVIYKELVKKHQQGVSFIIFLFFLISFVLSRTWTYLALRNIVPESLTENINGVHIHHFAYGILLTSVLGYLALSLPHRYLEKWRIELGILYGISLGLTFDEFGMWLRLRDDYPSRLSYDAVTIIGIIFVNIVYFSGLWRKLIKKIYQWYFI